MIDDRRIRPLLEFLETSSLCIYKLLHNIMQYILCRMYVEV